MSWIYVREKVWEALSLETNECWYLLARVNVDYVVPWDSSPHEETTTDPGPLKLTRDKTDAFDLNQELTESVLQSPRRYQH
jgi:hypothetical protein